MRGSSRFYDARGALAPHSLLTFGAAMWRARLLLIGNVSGGDHGSDYDSPSATQAPLRVDPAADGHGPFLQSPTLGPVWNSACAAALSKLQPGSCSACVAPMLGPAPGGRALSTAATLPSYNLALSLMRDALRHGHVRCFTHVPKLPNRARACVKHELHELDCKHRHLGNFYVCGICNKHLCSKCFIVKSQSVRKAFTKHLYGREDLGDKAICGSCCGQLYLETRPLYLGYPTGNGYELFFRASKNRWPQEVAFADTMPPPHRDIVTCVHCQHNRRDRFLHNAATHLGDHYKCHGGMHGRPCQCVSTTPFAYHAIGRLSRDCPHFHVLVVSVDDLPEISTDVSNMTTSDGLCQSACVKNDVHLRTNIIEYWGHYHREVVFDRTRLHQIRCFTFTWLDIKSMYGPLIAKWTTTEDYNVCSTDFSALTEAEHIIRSGIFASLKPNL